MDKLSFILGALIATTYFVLGYYVHYKWGSKPIDPIETEKQIVSNKALESVTDDRGFFSYRKYKR